MIEEQTMSEAPVPQANTPGELNIHLGYIRKDLLDIKNQSAKDLKEIKDQITTMVDHFITEQEFAPYKDKIDKMVSPDEFTLIKRVVWGGVSLILTFVLGAILTLAIK